MRRTWTQEENDYLRTSYSNGTPEELETRLGRSRSSIYQHAVQLGLKKSPEYFQVEVAGRFIKGGISQGHRFAKGLVPWNAGMKGWVAAGTEATRFKPGQKPKQTMPLGSYRLNPDGHLQRKVTEDPGCSSKRWRSVAELVWIEANGPLPAGHIVRFKPGMFTAKLEEITLDRVECISRAENARRNSLYNREPELARLCQLQGAITRQVNRINRENKS